MKLIGIDLGGTKIEVVAIENNPENLLFRKRIDTEQKKGYHHLVKATASLYQSAATAIGQKAPLGIGVPGSVSPQTGLIRNANSQLLNGTPFKKDLAEALNMPVAMENDANCLALSELHFGAAQGFQNVMAIIMGTGMGSGLIINGQLVSGYSGIAGEIGHLSIDINGKKCWCGNRGCLELYLSGTGLENLYLDNNKEHKKAPEIYRLYLAGEKSTLLAMQQFIDIFGWAMANITSAIDPEIIVIGGGLSNMPLLYQDGMISMKSKLLDKTCFPKITPSQLGDSSGVFGAAALNYRTP